MARGAGEQTRARLLGIGMRLAYEQGATAGVQHIRLQDVLRLAGMSTGAAYRLWPDQTAYQRDLAAALIRLRLRPPAEAHIDAVAGARAQGGTLDDVIRAASASHIDSLEPGSGRDDSRAFLLALALRAGAAADPELARASHERHAESVAEFAAFYGALMREFNMRMREPFTLDDFTEAMASLGEGFAVRRAQGLDQPTYDVPAGAEMPAGTWTLFGCAVRALVHGFMVAADDDRDDHLPMNVAAVTAA